MEKMYSALIKGLKEFKKQNKIQRVILGLSGGLDSAIVAVLAAEVFGPGNVYAAAMPSKYTSALSNDTAKDLAGVLGINYCVVPISENALLLEKDLQKHFAGGLADITKQNIQARIRGLILMAFANQLGGVVLTTGNKSEIYTGYCTLYGDTCGAVAPIGDVYKSSLYHIADYINRNGEVIPQAIINRPPTAELAPGQKDQDTLPPYEILDDIIELYVFKKQKADEIAKKLKLKKAEVNKTIKLIESSSFKRLQLCPVVKVCEK